MGMEVEPIYFTSQKNSGDEAWRRLFSIGDVEKSSVLSYTRQMNNPAASQNPSTF